MSSGKVSVQKAGSGDLPRSNLGALSVHSSLQMSASDANDSVLSYSEQMKRGEYEQGRMNLQTSLVNFADRVSLCDFSMLVCLAMQSAEHLLNSMAP